LERDAAVLRDELEREPLARVDAVLRDELEREPVERDPAERDPAERDPVDRDPLARVDAVLRDELAREPDDDALAPRPFDELLDERRRLGERRPPPFRSAAGTSSRATAFASCWICRSRNLAIRSSSRRMPRASFAVSLSPTESANDSMPA